jgi:D-alanyl-lipoteichoic acid acyltransferase DltB (MBOAT superfamily)
VFLISLDSVFELILAFIVFLYVPARWRWCVLLAASAAFLWSQGAQVFAPAAFATVFAYGSGRWLARHRRFWPFAASLVVLLAPLIVSKARGLAILGLSYYTFQLLSYVIEIYWGRILPEKNFGRFLLYGLLFMNKTAGPIERPQLLAQFREIQIPESSVLYDGVLCILLGLFEKFVLADQIGALIEPALKFPESYKGLELLAAVLLLKYQIFCDFAGISMIAVGLGKIFGLELMENFRRPFAAKSLRDYWRRWHISLQIWIREYVFYPLLGTPLARLGLLPVLIICFIVFGLWHDLRWTFVLYGLSQGIFVYLDPMHRRHADRRSWPAGMFAVMFNYVFLISLPGVLFVAPTIEKAWRIWSNLGFSPPADGNFLQTGDALSLSAVLILAAGHEFWLWADEKAKLRNILCRQVWIVRLTTVFAVAVLLLAFGHFKSDAFFIYSRF